ncbi:nuclear localization protein-like protein NPL6 [Aaosphaeria arxii CBS 175.79]|uniref:Nuclear localization protein-like protein NPL6 n=1 Tax=Aaosphaeria arxii CBS 175.79 TaxID=1450172 RepID=A0A6A5Y2D0_9PLEO|nr:nuclear localization protein-like protein NPL6 [Aaosphaeria arxii CBS 175.79]KAF2019715.1 nuclear localization protein-like protein NPL6 [Aaosphaeria arxii CBS 175.79]
MARGRPSRAAARRSTPLRVATPPPDSDDEMIDAPESRAETPAEEEDEAATPAHESEEEKAPSERSSPPVVQPFPRKKRLGRPPKNRPPDWNVIPDNVSEGGTPIKRKRGRPAGGGFRGRPRGVPAGPTRVAIDKEGTMMDVVNDEVDLPDDPEGETKVDKMGNLQGGRDYRVRVFTIGGRGDRLYMLSTEPARCCGFRDSYLFFTKHMKLHKIIIDDTEKRDLIDREVIPHSYKGRAIGVVTARSVFREFGARIVIGGKRVIDDYYAQAARERGEIEGEIAEPHDKLPPPGEPYNKNQYVAWHGASAVYHTGVPSVPITNGKLPVGPKRKVNITSANWQFEHARSASRFNSVLSQVRKENMQGIYDPHTNLMCFPKITQPTHARWEEVPPSESDVPSIVRRNYLIVDRVYQNPPFTGLGNPGADADFCDIGPNGLPKVDDEDLEKMTPEARAAFVQAKSAEAEWRNQWQTEHVDGKRAKLKIAFTGVPV